MSTIDDNTMPGTDAADGKAVPILDPYHLRTLAEAAAGVTDGKPRDVIIDANGEWRLIEPGDASNTGDAKQQPVLQVRGFIDPPKIREEITERGLRVLDVETARGLREAVRQAEAAHTAKNAGTGGSTTDDDVTTDFIDCQRYDAFFWSWPAVEKFVMQYYLRMAPDTELAKIKDELTQPDVVGILHGDYSPQQALRAGKAGKPLTGYFTVRESGEKKVDGNTKPLIISPL